jgi:DnaJ-class molecular chaperone
MIKQCEFCGGSGRLIVLFTKQTEECPACNGLGSTPQLTQAEIDHCDWQHEILNQYNDLNTKVIKTAKKLGRKAARNTKR